MKRLRLAAGVAVAAVVLIIVAAAVLRPYLPWLIVLFFLASIFNLAARDR